MASKKVAKEKTDVKVQEEKVEEQSAGNVQQQLLKQPEPPKTVEKPKMRACGCCPIVMPPADPGLKYFEAPDGHMILGENTVSQVRDRRNNNWINPSR